MTQNRNHFKKTVFVSFYEAYPPLSGAAAVSWNVAKHVHGEKTLIQIGRRNGERRTIDGVNIITIGGFAENRFRKLGRLPGWIVKILRQIKLIRPETIVFEGASWVLYHWLLIKAILLSNGSVQLIYHAHNVEYVLRREKHSHLVAAITKWVEGRIFHEIDIVTAVSRSDREQIESLYGIKPKLLPNGVDIDLFNHVTSAQILTIINKYGLSNQTLLFMGSYFYKPNRDGIDFLIKKVMPRVVIRHTDAKLAIVGGHVPYRKSWLINPGYLDFKELPAFITACTIGVAPIFSGSGTRLKILEYMAAGKPVVSTAKGAEGLNLKAGTDFLVAQDDTDFVKKICKLLTDQSLYDSIGEKGQQLVSQYYSWKEIVKTFQIS